MLSKLRSISMLVVKQIKLSKMDTFCYLVGDLETASAALIDPAFDTDRILAAVREKGLTVTHVINTHCHADHTAGNAAALAATGARLAMHRIDADLVGSMVNRGLSRVLGGKGSSRPDILLEDGDTIPVGRVELTVIHTPGHTPGGICLYAPGHVFTGDTLFVEAVGRTDLPGGSSAVLLKSIRDRLYTLPGDTVVWPGHDYGPTPSSTIARELATNPFTLV
ncbi:MAG: MBL fold metallo-hydrolase [Desulfobacterales bacterium]|nr:MBL fold metallo-hydrolase [Desulfobacterales bacterium]